MGAMILFLGLMLSGSAKAETDKVIEIDIYPFLGSFRSTSFNLEAELSDKLVEACGSLENVLKIHSAKFETVTQGISQVRPAAPIGTSPPVTARFTLAYPRTTGEVIVTCK